MIVSNKSSKRKGVWSADIIKARELGKKWIQYEVKRNALEGKMQLTSTGLQSFYKGTHF